MTKRNKIILTAFSLLAVGGIGAWLLKDKFKGSSNEESKGENTPTPPPDEVTDMGKKDGKGNRLVEVKGKGGKDNGKIVRGYELPKNINDNAFPLKIIVKPNGYLAELGVGKTATVTKEDDWSVKLSKDNFAFYEALMFNSLRAEA